MGTGLTERAPDTAVARGPSGRRLARPAGDAAWHSLEVGLRQVAGDTGGDYYKVYETAGAALSRVAAALAGHYVLAFERPEGRRGEHRIQLALAGRHGTVLTRTRYAD